MWLNIAVDAAGIIRGITDLLKGKKWKCHGIVNQDASASVADCIAHGVIATSRKSRKEAPERPNMKIEKNQRQVSILFVWSYLIDMRRDGENKKKEKEKEKKKKKEKKKEKKKKKKMKKKIAIT